MIPSQPSSSSNGNLVDSSASCEASDKPMSEASTEPPKKNRESEMLRALTILFSEEDVFEVRAIHKDKWSSVHSGYYTGRNLQQCVKDLLKYDGRAFLYTTLNPTIPDLLARASNRLREFGKKDSATGDQDIARRKWIPIDIDPKRPTDIASTDVEHRAAIDKALEIRSWLIERGWPQPVAASSGNGAHLLFRIDLPNDDDSRDLVKFCLNAIAAQFNDKNVSIDEKVFNSSRIWKLYGSLVIKGDNVPERPHRRAQLISVPETIEITKRELIEQLAAMAPQPSNQSSESKSHSTAGASSNGFKQPSSLTTILARAEKYIAKRPLAISGQGGHGATFGTACVLINGFSLPIDHALPLMRDWNASHCQPPWSDAELKHKLQSALKTGPPPGKQIGYLLQSEREPHEMPPHPDHLDDMNFEAVRKLNCGMKVKIRCHPWIGKVEKIRKDTNEALVFFRSVERYVWYHARDLLYADQKKRVRRTPYQPQSDPIDDLGIESQPQGKADEGSNNGSTPAEEAGNTTDANENADTATNTNDAAKKNIDREEWRSPDELYAIRGGQTYRIAHDRQGEEYQIRLCNFKAKIIEEAALDNGAEISRHLIVEGRLNNGRILSPARVPVSRFLGMNWPLENWGFGPSIAATQSSKDHLRAAIEVYSGDDVPRRTIFTHLGWRRTNEGYVYLHSKGAVGAASIDVDVEQDLQRYALPADQGDAVEAMRLSLSILDLGDRRSTFPLWASVWRATVCEWQVITVLLWLLGETGAFKSTTAALALSHFGGPFDKDSLPASWLDTENRLEQKCFLTKDALQVVDDFCPERHAGLAQELERRASRLIRAIGNRQGRGRMRSDLTARPSYVPRGLVISTAEQLPNLAPSALARILPVPFEKGGIDKEKLTALQHQAHLLPYAMRGFLDHLRSQADGLSERMRKRFEELRSKARVEGHDRLPEAVAHLHLGLELGIGYALQIGALEKGKAQELLAQGWSALMDLAYEHAKILSEERPTRVFLNAIQEGLASGRAWLASRSSGALVSGSNGPGAEKLGWVDKDGIYFLPGTAYAFASDKLRHRGGVVVGERALRQMLFKDGFLLRGEEGRLDVKPRIEGKPQRVIWLRPAAIELPPGTMRQTHCYNCKEELSSDGDDRCSTCGWLVCPNCASCKKGCEERSRPH